MSDSSNTNKFYVSTPSSANYELANNSILEKTSKFGTSSHRLLTAIGDKANTEDNGSTSYKYIEDHLFSTRNVKIHKSSTKSILDKDYVKDMSNEIGNVYKVLRFNRTHNIRAFEFIINYSQVSAFCSEIYKPIIQTKQFKGSLLFTGCSIVRDTDTMEELPLTLYGKYESIGDTPNSRIDLDNTDDSLGGPSITFKYTFDNDYVYLYISSISPFRLIPVGDGEYKDISYIEGKGYFTGENREKVLLTDDPFNNSKKISDFTGDSRIWCDISMSLKDVTISHDTDNAEFVKYDKSILTKPTTVLREQTVTLLPTNDGEQIVIGIEPSSSINLDITPDISPVRFGGSLLNSSKDEIKNYISKLKEKIISCSKYTEKVAFTIKTTIRTRGKYNINGDYFIDDNADGFGQILITDVGTYNSISNSFDITEYIFDKNQTKYSKLLTVKNYKDYKENASDYLTSISNGTEYSSSRKTTELLDVLSNIDFETPNNLNVYFNVAFIKSSDNFKVSSAYAEFGDNDDNNDDDYIVYICEDNKVRIINFKDYNMDNVRVYDLTKIIDKFKNSDKISYSIRSYIDGKYVYFIGTNNGYIIRIDNIIDVNDIEFNTFGAFDELGLTKETISFIDSDDNYTYIGGSNGSVSIFNNKTNRITYIDSIFSDKDPILLAKSISDDYVVFIAKEELASYCVSSNKWNYIGDKYRIGADFKNPFNGLQNPNIDYIIEKEGFVNVPLIQIDNFIYALGLRHDAEAGYIPVYKKMNILTGETINIKVPDLQLYRSTLCHDTRYIYCIGGSNVKETNTDENRSYSYIEIYDIIEDKWVDLNSNKIILPENIVFESSSVIHPVVYNKAIYIVHPKASIVSKNPNTGGFTYQEKIVNYSYKITFNETDLTVSPEVLSSEFESELEQNITIIPLISDKNKIHYFSGSPDLSNNIYNGYKLKKYIVNLDDMSINTSETVCATEYEFSSQFEDYASAPDDLFKDVSTYGEGNECIVFLLSRYIIYIYSNDNYVGTETHAVYHNVGKNANHLPLITTGTYDSWKKYNKNVSSNLHMFRLNNYIIFIGGDTCRTPEYLSMDSMSLIPAPSFYERALKNETSSVLYDTDDLINVVPGDAFNYDELATCKANDTIYLIAFNKNDLKSYLMKYSLNDPLKQPRIIKDVTQTLCVDDNVMHHVDIQYLSDTDTLLIASVDGISKTSGLSNSSFNVVAYNVSNGLVSNIVSNSDKFSLSKVIYPLKLNNNEIDYVSDKNVGYKISVLSGIITHTDINGGYNLRDLNDDVSSLTFAKGVYCYDKSFFIINKTNKADIECIDINSKTNIISYTIPNSANYLNGDIYKSGNYVYATKGSNGSVIGNDIYRLYVTSLISENGGEKSVKHALLDTSSSRFLAPIAINKNNELIVFGLARPEKSILRVFHSEITKDTFVPYVNEIDISPNKKINYNRFNPKFTSFNVGETDVLFVFGGTQSLQTKTTKTVDVYDTQRHMWVDSFNLPTELSHISVCENYIVGSTQEDIEHATSKAYPKKIEFICDDIDKMSFTTKVSEYPSINNLVYPKYGKYCLNEDKSLLYIVPTLFDNTIDIDTKKIYCVDLINKTFIETSDLPELVYFETREVLGAFATIDNLVLITYSKSTNTISVLKYNKSVNIWNESKKIQLPFIPSQNKEYSSCINSTLSIFDNLVNAVKNDNTCPNKTKAILTLLNEENNRIYNVYFSYNETDNLYISSLIDFSNYSGGNIKDIDTVFVNKNSFTYLSDRLTAKISRLFPNNDSNAFGIKSIKYIDTDAALCRTCKANNVYSAKIVNDKLKIFVDDILSGKSSDYEFDISSFPISENTKSMLKFIDKDLYMIYSSNDNKCIVKLLTVNKKITANNELNIKTFEISSDYDIIDNLLELDKIYFESSNSIKVLNITDESINTYSKEIAGYFNSVFKEKNGSLYYISYKNNEFTINCNGSTIDKIDSSLFGSNISADKVKIINNVIYLLGATGYIYEFVIDDDNKFVKSGCLYSTELSKFDNNILIRYCDILDVFNGIKYTNPNYINNTTYCFYDMDVPYYDEVIASIQANINGNKTAVLYNASTHKLINQVELTEDIEVSENSNMFVSKVDGIYKLNILTNGKLIIIDYLTSIIDIVENDILKESREAIHIQYLNKYIIGNDESKYIIFDPSNNDVNENTVYDRNHEYKLKTILYTDDTFKKYYALVYKTGDTTYSIGKFDSDHNDLVYVESTLLPISNNDFVKSNIDDYLLIDGSSAIAFKLDYLNNKTIMLEKYPDFLQISKRINKSLFSLMSTNTPTLKRVYVYNNKLVLDNISISDLLDNTHEPIIRQIDDFYFVVCKEIDHSNYSIFFIDTNNGKYVKTETDINFSNNLAININNRYFDQTIDGGIVKLYHIVDIIDNKIRSLSIKIADNENAIKSIFDVENTDMIEFIYNDELDENKEEVNGCCRIFNVQNSYIAVLNNCKLTLKTLSSSWKVISTSTIFENANIFDSQFKLLICSDMIFVVNLSTKRTCVFENPYNGSLYSVDSFGNNCKNVEMDNMIYSVLSLIDDNVIYCDNTRCSDNTKFNVLIDSIKQCSEFYNKYIGVAYNGEPNSTIIPISEYEIGNATLSNETNQLTYRSKENIKVYLNMIYKSSYSNIVASTSVISKLNTSRFVLDYVESATDKVGEIYSFSKITNNGELVRNDIAYYDNTYSVTIINDKTIKIKINDEVYSFNSVDNEIPLNNKILPLVISYGEFENSSGEIENRYLSFTDIKGNIITFDKELKTFIDVSGSVNVDIPYYSTEAFIIQSYTNLLDDDNKIVKNIQSTNS